MMIFFIDSLTLRVVAVDPCLALPSCNKVAADQEFCAAGGC